MFDFVSGEVLLFDKPYRWTSFDVVNLIKGKFKNILNQKIKIGHAGTLDPLATGLLILLTGRKTREMEIIQAMEKEYIGTFHLGATTPSCDLEKEVDKHFPIEHIDEQLIYKTAESFIGEIMQMPPEHSAVKIDGKRAYEYARQGKSIEIKPRPITIKSFEITRIEMPEVDFKVTCSKGTYIRSLARDFGDSLNSGAYLSSLCRTRIGDYLLEDAMNPRDFVEIIEKMKNSEMI